MPEQNSKLVATSHAAHRCAAHTSDQGCGSPISSPFVSVHHPTDRTVHQDHAASCMCRLAFAGCVAQSLQTTNLWPLRLPLCLASPWGFQPPACHRLSPVSSRTTEHAPEDWH